MPSASRPFFGCFFIPLGPWDPGDPGEKINKNYYYFFFFENFINNYETSEKKIGARGVPGMRLGDSAIFFFGEHFLVFASKVAPGAYSCGF